MSHGLTGSDGMFAVRTAAWHGFGITFDDYPKREVAQPLVHNWEVEQEPLFRKRTIIDEVTGESAEVLEQITSHQANIRNDTGESLGVVSKDYTPVLNSELWDIGEALEKSGDDVMFETGGTLRGGSQVWLLVRLKDPIVIGKDPRGHTIPYYALQNSHDGTGAFRGQATMTRIVCANTSRAADLDARARGTEFTFRHSKNVGERVEQAREALAGWRLALADWQALMDQLITQEVTPENAQIFLEKFIPEPPLNLISERVAANIASDRAKWMESYTGITCEGIQGTSYGLVQASIEFLNWHRRANSEENRFKRSFLTKERLAERVVELAHAAHHESVGV